MGMVAQHTAALFQGDGYGDAASNLAGTALFSISIEVFALFITATLDDRYPCIVKITLPADMRVGV